MKSNLEKEKIEVQQNSNNRHEKRKLLVKKNTNKINLKI
jgi:hypothetical protein